MFGNNTPTPSFGNQQFRQTQNPSPFGQNTSTFGSFNNTLGNKPNNNYFDNTNNQNQTQAFGQNTGFLANNNQNKMQSSANSFVLGSNINNNLNNQMNSSLVGQGNNGIFGNQNQQKQMFGQQNQFNTNQQNNNNPFGQNNGLFNQQNVMNQNKTTSPFGQNQGIFGNNNNNNLNTGGIFGQKTSTNLNNNQTNAFGFGNNTFMNNTNNNNMFNQNQNTQTTTGFLGNNAQGNNVNKFDSFNQNNTQLNQWGNQNQFQNNSSNNQNMGTSNLVVNSNTVNKKNNEVTSITYLNQMNGKCLSLARLEDYRLMQQNKIQQPLAQKFQQYLSYNGNQIGTSTQPITTGNQFQMNNQNNNTQFPNQNPFQNNTLNNNTNVNTGNLFNQNTNTNAIPLGPPTDIKQNLGILGNNNTNNLFNTNKINTIGNLFNTNNNQNQQNNGGLFPNNTQNNLLSKPNTVGNLFNTNTNNNQGTGLGLFSNNNNNNNLLKTNSLNQGNLLNDNTQKPIGLFNTNNQNTGLLGNTNQNQGGLFNLNSNNNQGGLFNTNNQGGLFNKPTQNQGGLLTNNNQGGLFNTNTNTGGLLGNNNNQGGLFNTTNNNTGGLFNTNYNTQGGIFSNNNQGGLFGNQSQQPQPFNPGDNKIQIPGVNNNMNNFIPTNQSNLQGQLPLSNSEPCMLLYLPIVNGKVSEEALKNLPTYFQDLSLTQSQQIKKPKLDEYDIIQEYKKNMELEKKYMQQKMDLSKKLYLEPIRNSTPKYKLPSNINLAQKNKNKSQIKFSTIHEQKQVNPDTINVKVTFQKDDQELKHFIFEVKHEDLFANILKKLCDKNIIDMEQIDDCDMYYQGREINKLASIKDHKLENNSLVKVHMKKPDIKDLIYTPEEMLPVRSTKFETIPSYEQISRMTEMEIAIVPKFTVYNKHGSIQFVSPTDLRQLDIDKLIKIKPAKIEVYPEDVFDELDKPQIGQELNKQAILSFKNMAPKGQSYDNYISKLKNSIQKMKGEFIDYDIDNEILKMKVDHFQLYQYILLNYKLFIMLKKVVFSQSLKDVQFQPEDEFKESNTNTNNNSFDLDIISEHDQHIQLKRLYTQQIQEVEIKKETGIYQEVKFDFKKNLTGVFHTNQNFKIIRSYLDSGDLRIFTTQMISLQKTRQIVLFIHGYGSSQELMSYGSYLAMKNHRVYLFDLPGFGLSGGLRFNCSKDEIFESFWTMFQFIQQSRTQEEQDKSLIGLLKSNC